MAVAASPELEDLLARVALGDRAAFRRLYERTSAALFGAALRLCRRRDQAEEVLQDAFVNVWQKAGTYAAARSQPMTWLVAIVRHRALDRLRSEGRHAGSASLDDEEAAIELADDAPGPQQLFERAAEAHAIRECLEAIDGPQRQCLALAYYQGLSHRELAAHLAAPLGSVKVWLRRGLERVRRCLDRASAR